MVLEFPLLAGAAWAISLCSRRTNGICSSLSTKVSMHACRFQQPADGDS